MGGAKRVSGCGCNHHPTLVVVGVSGMARGYGCNDPLMIVVMAVVVGGAKRVSSCGCEDHPMMVIVGVAEKVSSHNGHDVS